jgi:hypothetical protein
MSCCPRLFLTAALLLIFVFTANSQANETKKPAPGKNTPADNAAAIALKERRAQAVSLLLALASDARSFRDAQLRARSLARIADALWDVDLEQGRTLLRKAWEAAEIAERESQQKLQEEIRKQTATGGGYAFNLPPSSRSEVLRLADRRDPALYREFRQIIRDEAIPKTLEGTDTDPTTPSVAASQPPPSHIDLDQALLFADMEQPLLDGIEKAKTSAERDGLYFRLAFSMMGQVDLRARDYVDKIEDAEFQKAARTFVDARLAIVAVEKHQTDKALQLTQIGELSHLQKAWVLARAAGQLSRTDGPRALSLVEDAGSESRRIEGTSADRPRALLAVANALLIVDHDRVWDATFEAVKAANSAEGFTGEDGDLNLQFKVKGSNAASTHAEPDFDLSGIFAILGKEDYYRAVGLARGFQGEAPRAVAVIAIARAVLSEKKLPSAAHVPTKN